LFITFFLFLLFKFWVQKVLAFCYVFKVYITLEDFSIVITTYGCWLLKFKSNVNVTFLDMSILASIMPNLSALWIKSLCIFTFIKHKRSTKICVFFILVPSCKLCMVMALSFFIVFIVWWNSCKLWFTPINLHLYFDLNFSWFYEFAFLLYNNCFMFGLACMHHWSWS